MSNLNQSYIGLRPDILNYINKTSSVVLDVGCAIGSNGKYLLDNKIAKEVYGIEYDEIMGKKASQYLTKVFVGNLNNGLFLDAITKENLYFDYIIFGDVLEHLVNPKKVLLQLKDRLRKNGKIIISVPNVAHLELFIQVFIKGTFPQNDRGIFDKTHLRWFTRKDLFSLVQECNLKVITYRRKFRSRDAIGSRMKFHFKIIKFFNKDLITFQHIVVCEHE